MIGLLRDTLRTAAKENRLLEAIYSSFRTEADARDDLVATLIALHNDGEIDALRQFETLTNTADGDLDFFLVRQVIEKVIPSLHAAVQQVMHCVSRLYLEAGRDLAAGTILNSFVEYCKVDPARAREALNHIAQDPVNLSHLLCPSIAAGAVSDREFFANEVCSLARHIDPSVRAHAIFAIKELPGLGDTDCWNHAIQGLVEIVSQESNDDVLAAALHTSLAMWEKRPGAEQEVVPLVETVLSKGGESTVLSASTILFRYASKLSLQLIEFLFSPLSKVRSDNTVAVRNIDLAVSKLLDRIDLEPILEFLEDLVRANGGRVSLDRTSKVILNNERLRNTIVTRWLLLGEPSLCVGLAAIISNSVGDSFEIDVDPLLIQHVPSADLIGVALKSIGYFLMTKPKLVTSLLLSLMHHAPDIKTLDTLGNMLFDPLLVNYPATLREYLEHRQSSESDPVRSMIEKSLEDIDEYFTALDAIPELPALRVSQTHRETYRRHLSEFMSEAKRKAEEQSVLLHLFSRQTIIYGVRTITHFERADGTPERIEAHLHEHSVSIELPRLMKIDYLGFENQLKVFRLGRWIT